MTTTDTPRTDAATELYGDRPFMVSAVPVEFAQQLEQELNASQAEVERLKAELAKLKELLDEDSYWQTPVKQQHHITKNMDDSKKYEGVIGPKQRAAMIKADNYSQELARTQKNLLKTENDLLQSQDINSFLDTEFRIACKRAERAEAEVERLKSDKTHLITQCANLLESLAQSHKSPSTEWHRKQAENNKTYLK